MSGCIRYPDCRNCLDEFCLDCSDYEGCNQCISGAIIDEETQTCVCPPEKPYNPYNYKCGSCPIGCLDCTDDLRCLECDPGYYLVSDELTETEMC